MCCRIRVNSTSVCACFVLWEICPLSDARLLFCNHFVARTLGTPDPRTTSSLVRADTVHPCSQQTARVFTLHSPEPPVATASGIIGSERRVRLRHCRRCYSGCQLFRSLDHAIRGDATGHRQGRAIWIPSRNPSLIQVRHSLP